MSVHLCRARRTSYAPVLFWEVRRKIFLGGGHDTLMYASSVPKHEKNGRGGQNVQWKIYISVG